MLRSLSLTGFVCLASVLAGCGVASQLHTELNYGSVATETVAIDRFGVGVLTPSAPTGQESDKQALGDALGIAFENVISGVKRDVACGHAVVDQQERPCARLLGHAVRIRRTPASSSAIGCGVLG